MSGGVSAATFCCFAGPFDMVPLSLSAAGRDYATLLGDIRDADSDGNSGGLKFELPAVLGSFSFYSSRI